MTLAISNAHPHNMSRIPVPINHGTSSIPRSISAPTRLEQLRLNFQAKLALEKQLQLVKLYKERHAELTRNKFGNGYQEQGRPAGGVRAMFQQRRAQDRWATQPTKMSIGRDRSHPLSPVSQKNKTHSAPSSKIPSNKTKLPDITKRHPPVNLRSHSRSNSLPSNAVDSLDDRKPKVPPSSRQGALSRSNSMTNVSEKRSTQRPNSNTKRKPIMKAKLHNPSYMAPSPPPHPKPKSEFHQWKQQQDEERENRLKQHQQRNSETEEVDQTFSPIVSHRPPSSNYAPREPTPEVEMEIMSTRDFEAEVRIKEQQLMKLLQQNKDDEERRQRDREREEQEQSEYEKRQELAKRRKKLATLQHKYDESENFEDPSPKEGGVSSRFVPTPPAKPPTKQRPSVHRRPVQKQEPEPEPKPTPFVADPEQSDKTASAYLDLMNADPDADFVQLDLRPCNKCGRKFSLEKLQKHEKVCQAGAKKRKVFNTTKMRTVGTDQAQFVNRKSGKDEPATKKKSSWKTNHENFIKTIRYAREVKVAEETGGAPPTPPPATENPDYTKCPHCQRSFNSSAAERHIPRCQKLGTKPTNKRR